MPSLVSHDCQPYPAPKHICRPLTFVGWAGTAEPSLCIKTEYFNVSETHS